MTTILHVSDLHFGKPAVPAQIDAIEARIQKDKYDIVAISGDLSQRARAGEFQRAAAFIRDAKRVSQVIVVPGNHDVAWWFAPLGIGARHKVFENYQTYVHHDIEPVLQIPGESGAPGITIVGLNTSHGVTRRTLTWNMRDISIIGDLTPKQLEYAANEFKKSPDGDVKIIVMHHNPVKGELSQRHGLKNTPKILGAFAEMGVDIVMCGHDHQEAVHYVEHTLKGTVVSTAGTVSNRSRGGRPSSLNVLEIGAAQIVATTHVWSAEHGDFIPGPQQTFKR